MLVTGSGIAAKSIVPAMPLAADVRSSVRETRSWVRCIEVRDAAEALPCRVFFDNNPTSSSAIVAASDPPLERMDREARYKRI